jgi:hypothetical protein
VKAFSNRLRSAMIISIVSKWRPSNFIFNQGSGVGVVFGQKLPGEKGRVIRCVVMQTLQTAYSLYAA